MPENTPPTYTLDEICLLLLKLGLSTRFHGFYPTAYSVLLCIEQPERILLASKWVYPDVAKQYHSSAWAVERNIRTLARHAWDCNPQLLNTLAQQDLKKCPTTKEFISIISTYLLFHKAA